MSFGRLLAAGRSLIGLRNGESRYRENKQARLPKFISPKNPFATPGKSPEPVAVVDVEKPVVAALPAAEQPAALKVQPTPASASGTNWLGGWRQKWNPFGARPSSSKSAMGGSAGAARQGELALERVQVMRNDFSDMERETAPPQPKTVLPGLPVMAVTMEKLEPVGAAWNRLAAKFIGTDQT